MEISIEEYAEGVLAWEVIVNEQVYFQVKANSRVAKWLANIIFNELESNGKNSLIYIRNFKSQEIVYCIDNGQVQIDKMTAN